MVRHTDKVCAILDGDIIAAKGAARATADDTCELADVHNSVRDLLEEWQQAARADTIQVCLSEGRCFRYDAYPEYKANRKGKPPIPGRREAIQFLKDNYPCVSADGLEADDVMGILATQPQDAEVRIIVSTDKDMLQIPAWQVNPDKDRFPHKPMYGSCVEALVVQAIAGDATDGYGGIPGWGPVKVKKFIEENGPWYPGEDATGFPIWLIRSAYAEAGQPPERWRQMLTCAAILTWDLCQNDTHSKYLHSLGLGSCVGK